MSTVTVVYYNNKKKTTRTVTDVVKISEDRNLLKLTLESGKDVVFLMSDVLSYKGN